MKEKAIDIRQTLKDQLPNIELGASKTRVSLNLDSELADKLINYAKRKGFKTRNKLLEYLVVEWSKKEGIF